MNVDLEECTRNGLPLPLAVALALALALGSLACGDKTRSERSLQKQRALSAKTQLFEALSARLKAAVSKRGIAAAVSVCADEAPAIANAVADSSGVRIGRTSSRLRNLANSPPKWAALALEKPPNEATFVELPGGALGALYPIRLKKMCENCHGAVAGLPEPVTIALAKHYPADRATGYKEGDLRGWFWIEVPAQQ